MFKVIRILVTLGLLFATNSIVTASPAGITKRDANTCPSYPYYPSRSLSSRQNGNGMSFTGSQWIWTNEVNGGNAPVGTRAFRKTLVPPQGKTPSSIKVAFAIDNGGTLFVNGQELATEGDWFSAGTYCVPLQPYQNVIAINVTNAATTPNPAGLLVTAEVTYTDGSTSRIISDGSWRSSGASIPNGWEQPSFDDSTWALAVSEGAYPMAPWGNIPIAGSDAVSLAPAKWIWTNEVTTPGGAVPAGARALRRTVILPPGHNSASAEVLITADNEYSLYVNGRFVGTGTDFHTAQRFTIDNIEGPKVVIAVYAVNTLNVPNPAALIASMQIKSTNPSYECLPDCSSETYVITDGQWKATSGVPNGFEQPDFDDSTWPAAVTEGTVDSAPWAPVSTSAAASAPGAPLSGAPAGN
ncbi:hypothetical protein K435DRAFT_723510 [Dendrothele bispora CBS 962.96]|uniref:Concanavalin A-like lectin/glucanase n=1 Tax=Dendrothele bispora (strain CBS 962.96) TaxID=1314807 RepID=A0A4S8M0P5_DENBC|nr:hypothetical protein K435DRAFT_723510 [Dendrothele bispora CBS 962.96]